MTNPALRSIPTDQRVYQVYLWHPLGWEIRVPSLGHPSEREIPLGAVASFTHHARSEPSRASWRLASRLTRTFQGQLFHP
jgi:hypothetical protein